MVLIGIISYTLLGVLILVYCSIVMCERIKDDHPPISAEQLNTYHAEAAKESSDDCEA